MSCSSRENKNTNTTIIKSGAQQGTKQLIKMLVD